MTDSSVVPVDASQYLPAVDEFKYLEGEDADYLRQEVAEIRADLVLHNRQKLRIGARLVRLEPLLKEEKRFMHWARIHFCAPDAAFKCSYESLINYMNLVKHSTGNTKIPANVLYEVYRNNPEQWRVDIARSYEEKGTLTYELARIVRRSPRYVVEKLQSGMVDIPTAYQFTEAYLKASQSVQRLSEQTGAYRAVTVNELQRAYEAEGQGKSTRFSDVAGDQSLNLMSGQRIPLSEANELHWDKFLRERQVNHIDHSNLVKYDWMVDQVGEVIRIPAGEGVVFSMDEDVLVFIIKNPAPDLMRQSGRRGKIRLGLEVVKA